MEVRALGRGGERTEHNAQFWAAAPSAKTWLRNNKKTGNKYKHTKHIEIVKQYRPKYCTVRDIIPETDCQMIGIEYYPLEQILDWAYQLQEYAENVIIIPKSIDYIEKIPEQFMLGYSVPTSYGGTPFDIGHFTGKRIHLLGGSWKNQLALIRKMGKDIISFDNNHISKLARVEIKGKEKSSIEKDFSSILDFVKKIEKLNTGDVKPMNYPVEIYNVAREDKITNTKRKVANNKKLINSAPAKKDGFIKVKQVL